MMGDGKKEQTFFDSLGFVSMGEFSLSYIQSMG